MIRVHSHAFVLMLSHVLMYLTGAYDSLSETLVEISALLSVSFYYGIYNVTTFFYPCNLNQKLMVSGSVVEYFIDGRLLRNSGQSFFPCTLLA